MNARRLALLSIVAACSSSTDGPTPTITTVAPAPLCDAQHDVMLTITGTGFSPIVRGTLTSAPNVEMPRVVLTGTAGTVEVPPADVTTPDTTGTELILTLPAGLAAPGVYDVEVIDPDGHQATLASGLTIDPPPQISSVTPVSGASGSMVTVTLAGTGFRPGLTLTLESAPPVIATAVMVAPDGTSVSAVLDLTNVKPGTYDLVVDNGDGCTSTLATSFTVTTPHEFAITGLDPPFGCTCSKTNVTISSAGGFVSTPRVEMRPAGQASPVTLMERVAFVDASTLTAVVPSGLAL
ncbi:MAG TPA: IPT/TIG domain-containing protein, partial [Kofleriaceae bacterium]